MPDEVNGHLTKSVSQEVIPSDGDSARGSTPSLLHNTIGLEGENSPISSHSPDGGSLPSLPLLSSHGPDPASFEEESEAAQPFLKHEPAIYNDSLNSSTVGQGPRANDYPSDEEDQC